jgi:hypothetical protein
MDASGSRGSTLASVGGGDAVPSEIDSTLFIRDPVLELLQGCSTAEAFNKWAALPPTVWAQVFQILIKSGDRQLVRERTRII